MNEASQKEKSELLQFIEEILYYADGKNEATISFDSFTCNKKYKHSDDKTDELTLLINKANKFVSGSIYEFDFYFDNSAEPFSSEGFVGLALKFDHDKIENVRKILAAPKAQGKIAFTGQLKADFIAGKLAAYNDGTIRYDSDILELRPQVVELARLLIENHNTLVNYDDIKEQVIKSDRRENISISTINKYVNEFKTELKKHYLKDVIINESTRGYILIL